jgi:hypothetical protein
MIHAIITELTALFEKSKDGIALSKNDSLMHSLSVLGIDAVANELKASENMLGIFGLTLGLDAAGRIEAPYLFLSSKTCRIWLIWRECKSNFPIGMKEYDIEIRAEKWNMDSAFGSKTITASIGTTIVSSGGSNSISINPAYFSGDLVNSFSSPVYAHTSKINDLKSRLDAIEKRLAESGLNI